MRTYYNSWIENAEEQEGEKTQSGDDQGRQNLPPAASSEDSLLKLNKIDAPSIRSNNVEDSWWQEEQDPDKNGSDSSSSGSQESFS
ncbi:hypothetical protein OS493_023959 [Desmophyllum pertusum]|uniref:Uncharacterized protein n=1 Tax=Desmophyllum pertusum TaxID=174260 RepID=A0A9W9ZZ76_9CNID|nr:hypothetical protein OS493_023959 [Desmophyllum pertusum]